MEEITPEQKEQLSNWSIQRDALLGEIATLKTEKEKLSKDNTEIALSSIDIAKRIEQSIGRLAELDNTEKLYMEIVDSKIPELEAEKSRLTTEIDHLIIQLSSLGEKKEDIQKDIEFLIRVQSEVFNRTEILVKVVDHVTKINSTNMIEIETLVNLIKTKTEEILKLSTEDIEAHNRILNEIPRLFVELQKKVLIRKPI
jgi:seryl-tRNA synthetase